MSTHSLYIILLKLPDKEMPLNNLDEFITKVIKLLREVCGDAVFRNERNAFVSAYYDWN